MIRNTLAAALMLAFCGASGAAGLGRINVLSTLGQPLRAELELSASSEELEGMVVRMASPEAYKRANIDYPSALIGVKASIERRGGRPVVKLSSDKAFGEPFVNLLIDLSWAGGRLQREYTFLLDPAESIGPKVLAPVVPPVSRPVELRPEPVPTAPSRPVLPVEASKPVATASAPATEMREKAPVALAEGEDYTVQRGDTLFGIAAELKSDEVTQAQMVAALYRANADAFVGGNMNRLRAGRILKVPEAEEVARISRGEARRVIFKASNFDQYRQTVAAAAATAPAKDATAGQAASGTIPAKVVEPVAPARQSKDKVTVTAGDTAKPGVGVSADAKARIQKLEDEIASREASLKESRSRVKDLERNVEELKKLIDMKSKALADAQAAAKAADSRAEKAAKDSAGAALSKAEKARADQERAEKEKAEKAELARLEKERIELERLQKERIEQERVAAAKAAEEAAAVAAMAASAQSVPTEASQSIIPPVESSPVVVVQEPVAPPVVVQSAVPVTAPAEGGGLFSNLWALLALGAAVVGIGYVALKQRRKQAAAGSGNTQLSDSSTTSPNSVFGNAGGQTVDTGGTSLLHTDFSQSGMSAIDADEGVDPVAEADVYMAYGRDAQAEEILLDALKNDPSRTAVYVKLLEIYAQRRAVKQFENIATDLYTQTGGVGDDWVKASALGMKVDPENPLYRGAVGVRSAAAAASLAAELPDEVAADEVVVEENVPAVSFGTNNISQVRSTWTVPGELNQLVSGEDNVPVIAEASPVAAPVPEALNLDFNLDLDAPSTEDMPTQIESREEDVLMDEAVSTHPSGIVEDETPLEFDIGLDDEIAAATRTAGVDVPQRVESTESDFDIGIESDNGNDVLAEVDLEKTNFEGSLLDFDFELGDDSDKPALDLSSVNLHTIGNAEPVPVQTSVVPRPVAPIQDNIDVNDEVSTKLELAKAYEEMGDMEGARELLEEVVSDGADFQKEQAKTMLGRLV